MDVKYEVHIRQDEETKQIFHYEVTVEGLTVRGQIYGIGNAMTTAADIVFNKVLNEGRIK